jgi:hypothetical protein
MHEVVSGDVLWVMLRVEGWDGSVAGGSGAVVVVYVYAIYVLLDGLAVIVLLAVSLLWGSEQTFHLPRRGGLDLGLGALSLLLLTVLVEFLPEIFDLLVDFVYFFELRRADLRNSLYTALEIDRLRPGHLRRHFFL